MKITANLIVDSIEPCLDFWVRRLGFTKVLEVPHENTLGFVVLAREGAELMMQTRASLTADIPGVARDEFRSCLYMEVKDLKPIRSALADVPRIMPDRRTFYGADEVLVRDPAGNSVIFAQRIEAGG